jgi:UDP-N-acetylglucosamine transferase subunit ALG13
LIFVTVGSMLPFDRLVKAVDAWAEKSATEDVFAQIGDSRLRPTHLTWVATLKPGDYRGKMQGASLVVSHAGMGTIITALEMQKPIIVLPRRAAYREVTTDHQLATADWLRGMAGVHVAETEKDLPALLANAAVMRNRVQRASSASAGLLERVRSFIDE